MDVPSFLFTSSQAVKILFYFACTYENQLKNELVSINKNEEGANTVRGLDIYSKEWQKGTFQHCPKKNPSAKMKRKGHSNDTREVSRINVSRVTE